MWVQIISFTALWKGIKIDLSCNMQKLGHHMKIWLGVEVDGGRHNPFSISEPTRSTNYNITI
jgi:hypothetical protein